MREPTVATVMTTKVITAAPDTPFKELVDMLAAHRISAVPVVDAAGVPLGVISEADLLARQESAGRKRRWYQPETARLRAERRKAEAQTADRLMTSPALTVADTASVNAAARTMASKRVRRLFVVDAGGKLVGVVSRRDVLGVFLRPDVEIRDEIVDRVFGRAMCFAAGTVDAQVDEGVVTLTGTAEARSDVEITAELTKAVPGVVAVRNELGYRVDDLADTAL